MKRENDVAQIFIGSYLWVALADGELAHAEKTMCFKRLEKELSGYVNLRDMIEQKVDEFEDDYDKAVEALKKQISVISPTKLNKQELFEFAQKAIIDDSELLPGEELALSNLQKYLQL